MKRKSILAVILLAVLFFFSGFKSIFSSGQSKKFESQKTGISEGDIIFQTTESESSKAISLATHSPYTHCGIILSDGNGQYVLEAVEPVSKTSLKDFIDRGKGDHYVIKRLKNCDSVLTTDNLKKMEIEGEKLRGKKYDIFFGWSDERIYCSELVWKIYNRSTGLEVGKKEKLKNFDLSNTAVKKQLMQRYGSKIPYEETVISPAAIFNSPLLETIIQK